MPVEENILRLDVSVRDAEAMQVAYAANDFMKVFLSFGCRNTNIGF